MKIKLSGGLEVEREDKRNARAQGKPQTPAKRGRKPKAKVEECPMPEPKAEECSLPSAD